MCTDYRRFNHMTQDDKYSVWTLQDFTAELHWKKVFSKIDLFKGYHQVPVASKFPSKQVGKQVDKQVGKQTGKQASWQASKFPASFKQASWQTNFTQSLDVCH